MSDGRPAMSEQATTRSAPKEITCEQCRDLLSEYVDRELSDQEKVDVEHHVATCIKCASESTRLVGLKNIVQNWEGVKGSSKFREAVLEQYISESRMMASKPFTDAAAAARAESQRQQQESGKPQASSPIFWIAMAIAVLAAVALTAFLFAGG